jgi:hypothetical protein
MKGTVAVSSLERPTVPLVVGTVDRDSLDVAYWQEMNYGCRQKSSAIRATSSRIPKRVEEARRGRGKGTTMTIRITVELPGNYPIGPSRQAHVDTSRGPHVDMLN